MVAGKLDHVPRYRQKVRFVPFGAGPPVWVDDPHFNLGYHLRHTALPAPGSESSAAPDRRAHLLPAPGPRQAAVGDLDGRGPERRTLGAAVQGPPLHGRRRLRHRPDVGHVLTTAARRRPAGAATLAAEPEPGRRRAPRCARSPGVPARRAARVAARGAAAPRERRSIAEVARCARLAAGRALRPRRLVLADRPDRPASALELGARSRLSDVKPYAPRSAGPSTTSC